MDSENEQTSDQIEKYRWMLPGMIERMQTAFDTTIISMSAAGLGLSLTFYKDIVPRNPASIGLLKGAWSSWTLSVVFILISYYCSRKALERAIEQVDAGTMHTERIGGHFSWINGWFTNVGGIALIAGIICFALFVANNVPK